MTAFFKEFFDNWFELGYGFAYGLLSCLIYGVWGILLAFPVAVLWRLGGMKGHSIRVFGCPLLTALLKIYPFHWAPVIFYTASAAVLSMGYSTPDPNQKKASPLGTFFYNAFGQPAADIFTRSLVFMLLFLCFGIFLLHV